MEHVDDERVLCIKIYDTNKLDDMNTTHFTVTAWNARLRENRDVYVVSKRLEKKPSAFPPILPLLIIIDRYFAAQRRSLLHTQSQIGGT